MQRITRLPLLIDAVMTKLKLDDEEFDDWKMALAILNKVEILVYFRELLPRVVFFKKNIWVLMVLEFLRALM